LPQFSDRRGTPLQQTLGMKAPVIQSEKIYRVWSSRQDDKIAIRVRYVITEKNGCRLYTIVQREEWK
jgi:hypothetical protein